MSSIRTHTVEGTSALNSDCSSSDPHKLSPEDKHWLEKLLQSSQLRLANKTHRFKVCTDRPDLLHSLLIHRQPQLRWMTKAVHGSCSGSPGRALWCTAAEPA